MARQHILPIALAAIALSVAGCQQFWIDSADSIGNRIIRQRQQDTLGATSNFDVGPEHGLRRTTGDTYSFTPNPIDPHVPDSFKAATKQQAVADLADTNGTELEEQLASLQDRAQVETTPFTLQDALAYAFVHARDFQSQKEDLYLSALALMTERQLWTPQVVAEIEAQYANFGQVRDFDQAMTAVSDLSVTQRLPYGGQVAARIINVLMRDIGQHVTSGESGDMILEANIPLLRGAGRVAYESRYQAERNLIYAVRDFENARRDLVVDIAGDFFDLLARKVQIESAVTAAESALYDLERSQARADIGEVQQVEADRARVQYLLRSNDVINARIAYQALLDRFKIRLGMPALQSMDVVDVDLNITEPVVSESDAIETALKYRLDLINTLDSIDDARRQVVIAQNNFLPQFDFTGRVAMATDPNQKNSLSYNTERTTWQAFLNLEVPIDRREERNIFRASLIQLRRVERAYELAEDNVRLDVRDAMRALEQARISMEIQRENIEVNATRREAARVQFELGGLASNRDIVEAENDYQAARNAYANALANYRLAILAFLRDTGTFRVGDDGQWE